MNIRRWSLVVAAIHYCLFVSFGIISMELYMAAGVTKEIVEILGQVLAAPLMYLMLPLQDAPYALGIVMFYLLSILNSLLWGFCFVYAWGAALMYVKSPADTSHHIQAANDGGEEGFVCESLVREGPGRFGGCIFLIIQIGVFIVFSLFAFSFYIKSGISDRYSQGYVDTETQVQRVILFAIPLLILIAPVLYRWLSQRSKQE